MIDRALAFYRRRRTPQAAPPPRYALALGGGGVIGGMYEVGALTALEERLNGAGQLFHVYVGCSAGSVVASLLANGVRAAEIYRILDQDLADPLNFRRNAVFSPDSFRRAAGRFGQMMWAFSKNAMTGLKGSIPDMLARAERDLPPGFFSLATLERFMQQAITTRGLSNSFTELPRTLLIPAVDLDRAHAGGHPAARLHAPLLLLAGDEPRRRHRPAAPDLVRQVVEDRTLSEALLPRLQPFRAQADRPAVHRGLVMQVLHYAADVRSIAEIPIGDAPVNEAELKLALRLVRKIAAGEFRPGAYVDEVRQRIDATIARKVNGEDIVVSPKPGTPAPTVDLVEALRASLKKRRPAARARRAA